MFLRLAGRLSRHYESAEQLPLAFTAIHKTTFFLLNAEGTSRYASFLSILVMYRVAMRSLQFGQKIAP